MGTEAKVRPDEAAVGLLHFEALSHCFHWVTSKPDLGLTAALWDCSHFCSVDELLDAMLRFRQHIELFPMVDSTSVTFPTLCALFRQNPSDKLRLVFEHFAHSETASGMGLLLPLPKPNSTPSCRPQFVPPAQQPHEPRVDFVEVLVAFSLTCAGSLEERLRFVFDLFDLDSDGVLERDGLHALMSCISRTAARLQLAPPIQQNALEIELAVAAACRYRQHTKGARIEVHTESDDELSSDEGASSQEMSSESDDGFESRFVLTREGFVLFATTESLAARFVRMLSAVPRMKSLLEGCERRNCMFRYLEFTRRERPEWTIGHQGIKGSQRARDAHVLALATAERIFLTKPFFVPLGSTVDTNACRNGLSFGVVLELNCKCNLLVHVEEVVPDGGSQLEGGGIIKGAALQILANGIPPSDIDFENDPLMHAVHNARVLRHTCQAEEICTVQLPVLESGIRYTISIALDPGPHQEALLEKLTGEFGLRPSKPVPIWSAEVASPCVGKCLPDSSGTQAARRERGVVSIALVNMEKDSWSQFRKICRATNDADVLIHLGKVPMSPASEESILMLLIKAVVAAEGSCLTNEASADEQTRATFKHAVDQAARLIRTAERNCYAEFSGHSLPSRREELDEEDGYDAKPLHILSTNCIDEVALASKIVEAATKMGGRAPASSPSSLQYLTVSVLCLVRQLLRRYEKIVSGLDFKGLLPHLQQVGTMSVARVWEIWEGTREWSQVEARVVNLLRRAELNVQGFPGKIILLLSYPIVAPNKTIGNSLTVGQSCARTCCLHNRILAATDGTKNLEQSHAGEFSSYEVATPRIQSEYSSRSLSDSKPPDARPNICVVSPSKPATGDALTDDHQGGLEKLLAAGDDDALDMLAKVYQLYSVDTRSADDVMPHDPLVVRFSQREQHHFLLMLIDWCAARAGRDVIFVGVNKGRRISVCDIGIAAAGSVDRCQPVLRQILVGGNDETTSGTDATGIRNGMLNGDCDLRSLAWEKFNDIFEPEGSSPPFIVSDRDAAKDLFVDHLPTCPSRDRSHSERPSLAIMLPKRPERQPQLVLGPIVGRVSASTANIVVEADMQAPINVHFIPLSSEFNLWHIGDNIDSAQPRPISKKEEDFSSGMFPVRRISCIAKAYRPTVVSVNGLQPGTRYCYIVFGIAEHDPAHGFFRTESRRPRALTVLGMQSASLGLRIDSGEANPFARYCRGDAHVLIRENFDGTTAMNEMMSAAQSELQKEKKGQTDIVKERVDVSRSGVDDRVEYLLGSKQIDESNLSVLREAGAEVCDEPVGLRPATENECEIEVLNEEQSSSEGLPNLRLQAPHSADRVPPSISGSSDAQNIPRLNSWEYPSLAENSVTGSMGRILHSARPDVDIVIHCGSPFGPGLFEEITTILSANEKQLSPKEKVNILQTAYKVARNALRNIWRRPTAKPVLANGSHIFSPTLGDISAWIMRQRGKLSKKNEAAALCVDVLTEYSCALQGILHIPQDSDANIYRFACERNSNFAERGFSSYARHDASGILRTCGSIGIVLVKLYTGPTQNGEISTDTIQWLRATLSLDENSSDIAEKCVKDASLNTLLVVTDLPLFQSKLQPSSVTVEKCKSDVTKAYAAGSILTEILEQWCSQSDTPRTYHVLSSESPWSGGTVDNDGLQSQRLAAPSAVAKETKLSHRHCESARAQYFLEHALLTCDAYPKNPTVTSSVVPSKSAGRNTLARLSLGPILGEVTAKSATVLAEVNAPAALILDFRRDDFGEHQPQADSQVIRLALANTPVTFTICDLEPDCNYKYAVTVDEKLSSQDFPEWLLFGTEVQYKGADIYTEHVDLSHMWGQINEGRREGHFRTLAMRPSVYRVLAVRGDLFDPAWLREIEHSNYFAEISCDLTLRKNPSACAAALEASKSELCAIYPWSMILERSTLPNSPVSLVVHFTGPSRSRSPNSNLQGAGEFSAQHLGGNLLLERSLEGEATQLLQDEYRFAWGLPYVRDLMRFTPQIWAASPPIVTFASLKAQASRRDVEQNEDNDRGVRKICQAEDGNSYDVDECVQGTYGLNRERYNANASRVATMYQGSLLLGSSLSRCELDVMAYADERSVSDAVSAEPERPVERKHRLAKEDLSDQDTLTFTPGKVTDRTTTSTFRRFGGVGVLVLDASPTSPVRATSTPPSKFSRLHSNLRAHQPFRTAQWTLLQHATEVSKVVALIICCDRPILPEPSKWLREAKGSTSGITESADSSITSTDLCDDPDALRFIDTICKWLAFPLGEKQPKNCIFLCGGSINSFKTVVYDRYHKCMFEQLCIGGFPEENNPFTKLQGTLIGRYDYEYSITGPSVLADRVSSPPSMRRVPCHPPSEPATCLGTFGIVTVLADVSQSHVEARLGPVESPRIDERKVALVVGPVLGPFMTTSSNGMARATATILLEVDDAAQVRCVCQDVLSLETYVGTIQLAAYRARTVQVPGLRLGSRYMIRVVVDGVDIISGKPLDILGINPAADVLATDDVEPKFSELFASEVERQQQLGYIFHTPDDQGVDYNVCVLSGHNPRDQPHGEEDIVADVADRLTSPWHGIDLNLHIGMRCSFLAAIRDAALTILRRKTDQGLDNAVEEAILERFRDEYRSAWSMPAMRMCLAGAANVMTGCARTLLFGSGSLPAMAPDKMPEDIRKELKVAGFSEWQAAVRRAMNLSQKISFEYERQLWDHHGWATRGKGHTSDGGLVTLHGGTIGIYLIDLGDGIDDERTISTAHGNCVKVRLMSDLQREHFLAALNRHSIAVMIVVLECVLFKPRPPCIVTHDESARHRDHLSAMNEGENVASANDTVHWEFCDEDLSWIAERLLNWRAARGGREVHFLCGVGGGPLGWPGGLRSNISLETSSQDQNVEGPSLHQTVVGPFMDQPQAPRLSTGLKASGRHGSVFVTHEQEDNVRHFRILELTADRLFDEARKHYEIVSLCVVSKAISPKVPRLTVAGGRETFRTETWRLPMMWTDCVGLDIAKHPGFVDESVWYALNQDGAVVAMRAYVGGGGRGPGDANFLSLLTHTYSSSNIDEFRKPPKLRENLTQVSGPLLTHKVRFALVELYRSLPFCHRATLARLDDLFVGRVVVSRACAERDIPMSLENWHDYVARCFILAAALRKGVIMCTTAAMEHPQFEKGGLSYPPTSTTSKASGSAARTTQGGEAQERAAQERTFRIDEADPESPRIDNPRMVDTKQRSDSKLGLESDDPWEKLRHVALIRKEERRRSRAPPPPDSTFADRQVTKAEQERQHTQLAEHNRKEAAKTRLESYDKRVKTAKESVSS